MQRVVAGPGSFPIYGLMGDGQPEVMNVEGAWRVFVMGQKPPPPRRR